MNNLNIQIGALIRECREKANLTQLELSKALGYDTPQFVSLMERGLSKAPAKAIGRMTKVIGLPGKRVTGLILDAFKNELLEDIAAGQNGDDPAKN